MPRGPVAASRPDECHAVPGVSPTPRHAWLLALPPLFWAGNAVVGRMMVGQVPPFTLNFLRWCVVALLLLPLGWRAFTPWSRIAQRWRYLLVTGGLAVGVYNSLQYLALVTSSPLNVTLVAASMPVWMLGVGSLFYGKHPSAREVAGALLGLAGVAVVIGRGSLAALAGVHLVAGDLYMVGALVGWAFYSWILVFPPEHMKREQAPGWTWAELLLLQTLFGLAVSAVAAGGEQLAGAAPIQWKWSLIAVLLYVALFASIAAVRCWNLGVAASGPALAAFFLNLTPLFAALLSALLLGETPMAYHGLAFVLIAVGIAVGTPRIAR